MVVEQHPTLLNVTMYTSKVGQPADGRRVKPRRPPWASVSQATKTIFAKVGPVNFNRRRDGDWRVYSDASPVMGASRSLAKTAIAAVLVSCLHAKIPRRRP